MATPRPYALTLGLMAMLWQAAPAHAGEELKVERRVEGGTVQAVVSATGLVDSELRERLQSGLTSRLVVAARLVPEGFGGQPVVAERVVEVVFDLWENRFVVEQRGAGPPERRTLASLAEVDQYLARPVVVELGPAASCTRGRRYRVEASLLVNPISERVKEKSRELLDAASEREAGQGRSLLGSVARIFFNVSAERGARELTGRTGYELVSPGAVGPPPSGDSKSRRSLPPAALPAGEGQP